jgi:tetratricopeptide (TPR) repeat protein
MSTETLAETTATPTEPEARTLDDVLGDLEREVAQQGRKHPRARALASEARRHPQSDGYVEALILERSDRGEAGSRLLGALERAARSSGPESDAAKQRFEELVAAHPVLRALAEQRLVAAAPKPPREPAARSDEGQTRTSSSGPRADGAHGGQSKKPRPLPQLIRELENVVSRFGREDARVLAAVEAVRTAPDAGPDVEALIAEHTRRGEDIAQKLAALEAAVTAGGVDGEAAKQAAADVLAAYPFLQGPVDKRLGVQRAPTKVREPKAAPTVSPREHRLDALTPRAKWTLLVDERSRSNARGEPASRRAVGLLLPRSPTLRSLPRGWRARDMVGPALDAVLDAVLADRSAGILGLTRDAADAAQPKEGEGATRAMLEIVQWVARLLPIDGPTEIDVMVEARGDQAAAANLRAAFAEAQHAVAGLDPRRHVHLSFRPRAIRDGESPFDGYVDALAHLWKQDGGNARLVRSGLIGVCLSEAPSGALAHACDLLTRGAVIEGETWRALLDAHDGAVEGSLAHDLLERAGEACSRDLASWRRLLEATRAHLGDETLDVLTLGREVAWLQAHAPANATLSPQLELVWRTAQLDAESRSAAPANAATSDAWNALAERLYVEDARLVCRAALARAGVEAGRLELGAATQQLARFAAAAPEIPGLRAFAQVQRALGELAARRGEHTQATEAFARARGAFGRLADGDVVAFEQRVTALRRAAAILSDPAHTAPDARAATEELTPLTPAALAAMARDAGDHAELHPLVVRFLGLDGSPEERAAYLGALREDAQLRGNAAWAVDAERALLLRDAGRVDEARAHAKHAAEVALETARTPAETFAAHVLARFAVALGVEGAAAAPGEPELRGKLVVAPWAQLDEAIASGDARAILRIAG